MKGCFCTEQGGAVSIRNSKTEKMNIKHLRRKWPGRLTYSGTIQTSSMVSRCVAGAPILAGVFLNSPRGDCEVRMYWDKRDKSLGGQRWFFPDPKKPGNALGKADAELKVKKLGWHTMKTDAVLAVRRTIGSENGSFSSSKVASTKPHRPPAKIKTPPPSAGVANKKKRGNADAVDGTAGGSPGPAIKKRACPSSNGPRVGALVYVRPWGKSYVYKIEAIPSAVSSALVKLLAVKGTNEPAQAPMSQLVVV